MGYSPAGGNMSGADDVAISNPIDNQVLTYDSGTGLWRNEAAGGGSGDPTVGGDLSGTASNAQIVAGAITNTEVSGSAAIAQSKIANLTTDLAGKASSTHAHAAADITSGTVAAARLGSGTPTSTNYLRGDGTWATPAGGGGVSNDTLVYFSTLSGASDDAKLASFMTAQSGGTYKGRTLILDEVRNYTFTQPQTIYTGFSLRGTFRPQDQARSSLPLGNEVTINISGGGGWFRMPASGNVFGVSISNISIDGNATSYLLTQNGGTAVLWTSVFRDISMQNCGGVIGTASEKLLTTAICIDGWWNVNNVRDQAFNIGGSDCFITPSMFLLDSPTTLLAANKYLMGFESQSKTTVQNFYITAEEHSAITITGSSSDRIRMHDMTIEGRNAGAPCLGALIRSSGQFSLRDSWTSYAMSNPTGNGRTDEGVIHITGGKALIDGCDYERATGVAESVPYIYVTGASTRVTVRNITGVGSWTGKPIVRQTQAGLVDADSSVTVITG